ncbi:MAG: UDP-N-acetylmuramoyl-L-alanyl-D-glutamate--2,6-diaminopimelate ligase, partial [Bacteroidetes bacterium]|nr:UDP-N-acetylmuramoyl-L-alanyl-D-glutamate--2,6-diaminopimelate ligase [Bacteroidota bacterium]
FTGGVFTNITHDHLDYHETFENYLKAKKTFFDTLPQKAFALTNADDRNGMVMVQNTRARVFTYALHSMADFMAKVFENQIDGMKLSLNNKEIWTKLVGTFNAYNLVAVFAAAELLGQDQSDVLIHLSRVEHVEGRFDCIYSKQGITGIVDYAHTPDAVKNVLSTITEIRTGQENLITVIGAGGDRDRTKRPLMASIACSMSDTVILTSDNPRSEEPETIIEEMKSGLSPVDKRKVITLVNRKEAIITACHLAKPGDIILVAGKGHEKYQEIKGVKLPFDDKKILEENLILAEQESAGNS